MKKTNIFLLGALVMVAVVVAVEFAVYMSGVVPYRKCSEVYKQYSKVEGVRATYVKDYRVNDTLTVGVTLLEATDSAGWAFLVDTFHISKDRIKRAKVMPDYRVFEWQVVRGQPETKAVLKGINRIPNLTKDDVELCICDFQEKEISIFHAQNAKEIDAIRNYNFDKMTNKKITNDEDKKN